MLRVVLSPLEKMVNVALLTNGYLEYLGPEPILTSWG